MIWKWRPKIALTFAAWLGSLLALQAQPSAVQVRSASTQILETRPGNIITASLVVANRGTQPDEFDERLILPPGCEKVAPSEPSFRLDGPGQAVRILAIMVPANMPAGNAIIRYEVQGRRDPSALDRAELSLHVLPVDDLALSVAENTSTIVAGTNYPIHLTLTNHGNSTVAVTLKPRSSLGYAVHFSPASFRLEPGATRELQARTQTDDHLSRKASHAVTFDVTAITADGRTITTSQANVAEVVPVISGDRDIDHRIPLQFTSSALFESHAEPQMQLELSGAGSLDEAGRRQIDFLFRGPDIETTSFFGQRDEYGASYHDETWDVQLGDRIYELSPLTERHAFGRGAGLTYHQGGTAAGAFYLSTRYRQHNTEEIGAFIRRDVTQQLSFQTSFLRKWGGDPSEAWTLPQNIVSVEARFRASKALDLRAEYGVSRTDSGQTDSAYRVEARGELFDQLTYAVEHTRAGPNFQGYDNDTQTTYATLAMPINKRWRAHLSVDRYAGNLALNPERSTVVNRENSWFAGVNYQWKPTTELSLEWQHIKREDILKPAAYDFTEDSLRFGLGQQLGKVTMQSFVDLGTLDNRLTGEGGAFQRYNVFVSYQATPTQSYSAFATYGPSVFSGSEDRSLSAGASAHWQLRPNISANLSYARNQFDSETGHTQDQATANLRYRFSNHDEIALVGRVVHSDAEQGNESAMMVTFTRPFGLAVGRKTSIGSLRGRLRCDGTGVGKVILTAGDAYAVTDAAGEFEFPALKPGNCEVKVIPDSLGSQLTMTTPLPAKVRIRPGETSHLDLIAAPAASLTVRLVRYEFADGTALKTSGALRESGGVGAVDLEISNGRDTWRAQTDRNGTATFERLAAGPWKLRVSDDGLPSSHLLENADRTLTLGAGQAKTASVRLLPRRRTIQLLDSGKIR